MTSVLLIGAGAVGGRAARQLAETPGVDRLLLADRKATRAQRLAQVLGPVASVIEWTPREPLPEDLGAVAVAVPGDGNLAVAARSRDAGVPTAFATDAADTIEELLAVGPGEAGTFALGCGLAPGLACVLARHGAGLFDRVDEIAVARVGAAGAASLETLRQELRDGGREWRRGRGWSRDRRAGGELVWFPDPIGVQECEPVTAGTPLLVRAFPETDSMRYRLGEPVRRFLTRTDPAGDWGAARVDVWGRRDGVCGTVAYGVVDRTAIAAGAVLAVTAAALAGVIDVGPVAAGVGGLAELVRPAPFLAELAHRGVRTAVFEGVPV